MTATDLSGILQSSLPNRCPENFLLPQSKVSGIASVRAEAVTALKEMTQARIGQVVDFAVIVEAEIVQDTLQQVDVVRKPAAVLAAAPNAAEPVELQNGFGGGLVICGNAVAASFPGSYVTDHRSAEQGREFILTMGIGEIRDGIGRGQTEMLEEGAHVLLGRSRSADLADQLDDPIAPANVVGQPIEQGKPTLLKVLLETNVERGVEAALIGGREPWMQMVGQHTPIKSRTRRTHSRGTIVWRHSR